jgi:hypothetical protein
MRPVVIRLALTAAAFAAAAGCLPAAAHAAAPQGSLTTAEYNVLLPAYQRIEQLSQATTPTTAAQYAEVCATIAPPSTHLIATEARFCTTVARWAAAAERFSSLGKLCPGSGPKCLARELERMETSTRKTATVAREERAAVTARGLTGSCRRAFTGSAQTIPVLDGLADGLHAMRSALRADDADGLAQATKQVQRAVRKADGIQDTDSAALLTGCPRT